MFFKIGVLKKFTIFRGKHLCLSTFLIKLQASFQYRCFPVNIAKFSTSHKQYATLTAQAVLYIFILWHIHFIRVPLMRKSHQKCSAKEVLLEISQNSQENTCASGVVLVSLLLTLKIFHTLFYSFFC